MRELQMNSEQKLRSGLLSVTFRQKTVSEIFDLAKQGGIRGIEWGSDFHVPPGDLKVAEEIQRESARLGLEVISYASYYRAGVSVPDDFVAVLQSAKALGTDRIRVWAGDKNGDVVSGDEKKRVIDDLLRISALAKREKVEIGIEYHNNTLTNTANGTRDLMGALSDSNVFSYWQPPVGSEVGQNIREIEMLGKWIKMIHVFHWAGKYEAVIRLSLREGKEAWALYFQAIENFTAADAASLEFVKDDSVDSFMGDLATLDSLLTQILH
jgi:sugar phosphate isomerase/epimerase